MELLRRELDPARPPACPRGDLRWLAATSPTHDSIAPAVASGIGIQGELEAAGDGGPALQACGLDRDRFREDEVEGRVAQELAAASCRGRRVLPRETGTPAPAPAPAPAPIPALGSPLEQEQDSVSAGGGEASVSIILLMCVPLGPPVYGHSLRISDGPEVVLRMQTGMARNQGQPIAVEAVSCSFSSSASSPKCLPGNGRIRRRDATAPRCRPQRQGNSRADTIWLCGRAIP